MAWLSLHAVVGAAAAALLHVHAPSLLTLYPAYGAVYGAVPRGVGGGLQWAWVGGHGAAALYPVRRIELQARTFGFKKPKRSGRQKQK